MPITLQDCRTRDAQDPLRALRDHFALPPGVIYLDGNSLGVAPKAAAARVADVVTREWGTDLIKSWNTASWFDLPQRLGNQLAPLIGAGKDEVVCTDSTSINLYKVLSAALNIAREDSPARKRIVSERSNFPTDLYIAEGLARQHGFELKLVEPEQIAAQFGPSLAVLMLTHVNYRTGRMHDMAAITRAAHGCGALALWDLAHSAGAVPVDLNGADAGSRPAQDAGGSIALSAGHALIVQPGAVLYAAQRTISGGCRLAHAAGQTLGFAALTGGAIRVPYLTTAWAIGAYLYRGLDRIDAGVAGGPRAVPAGHPAERRRDAADERPEGRRSLRAHGRRRSAPPARDAGPRPGAARACGRAQGDRDAWRRGRSFRKWRAW